MLDPEERNIFQKYILQYISHFKLHNP